MWLSTIQTYTSWLLFLGLHQLTAAQYQFWEVCLTFNPCHWYSGAGGGILKVQNRISLLLFFFSSVHPLIPLSFFPPSLFPSNSLGQVKELPPPLLAHNVPSSSSAINDVGSFLQYFSQSLLLQGFFCTENWAAAASPSRQNASPMETASCVSSGQFLHFKRLITINKSCSFCMIVPEVKGKVAAIQNSACLSHSHTHKQWDLIMCILWLGKNDRICKLRVWMEMEGCHSVWLGSVGSAQREWWTQRGVNYWQSWWKM